MTFEITAAMRLAMVRMQRALADVDGIGATHRTLGDLAAAADALADETTAEIERLAFAEMDALGEQPPPLPDPFASAGRLVPALRLVRSPR